MAAIDRLIVNWQYFNLTNITWRDDVKANVKSCLGAGLLLRYDIGSVIWDNTGRGNEEAGWSDQWEARFGSVLANQKPGEAMMRLPHCNEHSDIELNQCQQQLWSQFYIYIYIFWCLQPPALWAFFNVRSNPRKVNTWSTHYTYCNGRRGATSSVLLV